MSIGEEEIEEELESESEEIFLGEAESSVNFETEPSSDIKSERTKSKVRTALSGIVTEQHLRDIAHELGLIKLCWADVPQVDFEEYATLLKFFKSIVTC